MSTFFDKLPIISYNGVPARNFLTRPALDDITKKNISLFHPYTMREQDRIDVVSELYYDSPNYIWLIFLANNVLDPYYDLPLTVENFEAYIAKKYGSRERAMTTILYYGNNWSVDDSEYTIAQYNAIVAGNPNLAKYYDAAVDQNLNLRGYYRKREDWTATTNMIVRLDLSASDGTFQIGERIIYNTTNKGVVITADETSVTIQHIVGSFYPNNEDTEIPATRPWAVTIVGEETGVTATTSHSTILSRPIPVDELGLWAPVTAYDYELDLNEQRKSITLVENTLTASISDQLTKIMRS